MRVVAIVQARTGSTRLPGKVLADVAGRPLLARVLERAGRATSLDEIVVATSSLPGDRRVVSLCEAEGFRCFAGSETDVLDRYYETARAVGADHVVRLTGDCPLVDPALVDHTVNRYLQENADYVALATGVGAARLDGGRYPSGFDVECFSVEALERAWRDAVAPGDREHVTPYLWRTGLFRTARLCGDRDLAHYRCSVDTPEDLQLVRAVVDALGPDCAFEDVIALLDARPELVTGSRRHPGHEGYERIWTPWAA